VKGQKGKVRWGSELYFLLMAYRKVKSSARKEESVRGMGGRLLFEIIDNGSHITMHEWRAGLRRRAPAG